MKVALLCVPGACHFRQVASALLPVTLWGHKGDLDAPAFCLCSSV